MAAATLVLARPVSPTGWEKDAIFAEAEGSALLAGQLVEITQNAPADNKLPFCVKKLTTANAASQVKKYVVVMAAKQGSGVNIADRFEMEGWTGLTPGAPLYPSGTTAGGLDTDAPTVAYVTTPDIAIPVEARIHALTATRVKFNL